MTPTPFLPPVHVTRRITVTVDAPTPAGGRVERVFTIDPRFEFMLLVFLDQLERGNDSMKVEWSLQ
jgi:hypothetical protein